MNRGYTKIIEEFWSAVSPTDADWNPCRVVEDICIPAEELVSRRQDWVAEGSLLGLLFGQDALYLAAKALTPSGHSSSLARLKTRSFFQLLPSWSQST